MSIPPDLMPRLMSLGGPSELVNNKDNALQLGTVFLVDYEFKDEAMTGIELIQQLGLEQKAILVTNHFEQPDVLQAVETFGLRLLPKTYMLNAKFPIDIQGEAI